MTAMRALRAFNSLGMQLIAALVILLTIGIGALLIMTGSQVQDMTVAAFEREQETAVMAVSNGLGDRLESWSEGEGDRSAIQQNLTPATSGLGLTFSILTADGVIASTQDQPPTVPPDDLPEIAGAHNGQITTDIRDNRLYIAAPIWHEGNQNIGVIWANASMAPVWAELQRRWVTLIVAALMSLLLACVVGAWLAERIVRPVTQMTQVARQMAEGELTVRVDGSGAGQELTELSEAFNHMAQQIETMVQRQRDFVANASHELSSPLAGLKLRAEALASGRASGERAGQYAAEIDHEVTRLGRIVADLLQLSRTEDLRFAPPAEAINVSDEIMACVREIRPRTNARQQRFEGFIAEDIPDLFIHTGDLHLMVSNLLTNAVKYTPPDGAIALSVQWNAPSLIIEVCDNGEGIPADDLGRVTERFFRVDRAHTNHVQGTGLGLTLVVATAKQYAGKLDIQSTGVPGHGTKATLILKPLPALPA